MPQLIDTVADLLELSGAAVEKQPDRLEVLLPAATAATLQVGEHAVLHFDPATHEGHGELVTYQSEFVDRLFTLMQDQGRFADIKVADQYRKQGTVALAESRFTVLNGLLKALTASEQRLAYLCCYFKYTAISDEKREGMVCAVLNQHTLVPVPRLVSQLSMVHCEEGQGYTGLEPLPFNAVYRAACHQAQMLIHEELADFHRSLQRRLQRDITRLEEYYHSLSAEIERKIVRRQLTGSEREHEEARRHAVALERNRKIADQREKYALKIEVEPVSFLRLNVPVQVVTAELRCRKLSRETFFVWNALLKEFEPAICEGCHAALYAVQLCEEKLHLLCRACSNCAACGRSICHRCHPGKCPKCGERWAQP